jgi:FAD:protein FMN transferase
MTAGAFDITVKPLADLWGECEKAGRVPTGDELKSVMSRVGFRYIELGRNPATISFGRAGMSIDMGAIAKGYATDRAIAILKAGGILNAIVNSGGDMYCLGQRSADRPWKIGIQHPRDKDKLIIEFFLKDKAVDTSGDYENFFIIDGKRYSHIIDPRKGYPVGDDVVSASVIASDSETADALATALCILGKDGFSIIDSVAAAAGIIVVEEKAHLNIYNSEAFKNIYEKDK